jgi:hypothetical protein
MRASKVVENEDPMRSAQERWIVRGGVQILSGVVRRSDRVIVGGAKVLPGERKSTDGTTKWAVSNKFKEPSWNRLVASDDVAVED